MTDASPSGALRARLASFFSAQFVRFIVVGAANTAFNYLVYCVMLWLGMSVPLASLASLLVGILINFTTQSRLVFDNRDPWRILPYAAVWALLYAFNLSLIWMLMRFGFDAYIAGLLSTPCTVLLSFFLQKLLVFKTPSR